MSEFEVKMDMLISSLRDKNEALTVILNITENQEQLFKMEKDSDMWDMFTQMNEAKQEHIDRIVELDRLFQGLFEGISEGFEERAKQNIAKTAALQNLINDSLELDVKIRAAEQKNRIFLSQTKRSQKPAVPSSKSALLKKYEQNKKKPE